MKRATLAAAVSAAALALLVVVFLATVGSGRDVDRDARPVAPATPAMPFATAPTVETGPAAESHQGFLYGRVTTLGGTTYEGRLRWGGDEEAFWNDYFNGVKAENRWAGHVPADQLTDRRAIEVFGVELAHWQRPRDLSRPFMARFGDITRLEVNGREIRAILESGTTLELDRLSADDIADGVRIWDETRGVVDLDEWRIRTVEFLPTPPLGNVPRRLHGTVRTRQGDFTGFVRWNRQHGLGSDRLHGHAGGGELVEQRFDAIRAITRHANESARILLVDGHEIVLSGTPDVGKGNRGLFVDDPRCGRVLISWNAFERIDFGPAGAAGSGPAYGDFPPGRPLEGSVTTRDGRRLAGRLVYDLDESETTETLDAPSGGVDYTLPFGLVASIALPAGGEPGTRRAKVSLRGGEELELELAGDLGDENAGLLVFADGSPRPEYVPWTEVEGIDFDPGEG